MEPASISVALPANGIVTDFSFHFPEIGVGVIANIAAKVLKSKKKGWG